jgi:hypothetical protein
MGVSRWKFFSEGKGDAKVNESGVRVCKRMKRLGEVDADVFGK